jgi:hypothetical protein
MQPQRRLVGDAVQSAMALGLNVIAVLDLWWSVIFSENRYPPIGSKPEGMLFRIML